MSSPSSSLLCLLDDLNPGILSCLQAFSFSAPSPFSIECYMRVRSKLLHLSFGESSFCKLQYRKAIGLVLQVCSNGAACSSEPPSRCTLSGMDTPFLG